MIRLFVSQPLVEGAAVEPPEEQSRYLLAVMRHLLNGIGCPAIARKVEDPDPEVLFPFEAAALKDGRLER